MTVVRVCLGAALGLALSASLVSAQCYYPPIPQAPDACGPGYYCTGPCGMTYGPGYCLRPPFPPFQGMVPGPPPRCAPGGGAGPGGQGPAGSPQFPMHPYARSPRDFFMWYDRGIGNDSPQPAAYFRFDAFSFSVNTRQDFGTLPPPERVPVPLPPPERVPVPPIPDR